MMSGIFFRAAMIAALSLSAGTAAAQTATSGPGREVVLDGVFYEWAPAPVAATATTEDHARTVADSADPYPRPVAVRVRHDAGAVYLALTLDRAVSLQSMPGSLVVLLDADGDTATGWAAHGMRGVDAALEFSPVWPDGMRAGAGLRTRNADSVRLVSANQAGLIVAPSYAAREFEMRIARRGPVPFGERMSARVVSLDADGGPVHSLGVFRVPLENPAQRPAATGAGDADPLARAAGTEFRVVSWNVARQALFQHPDDFGAILRALDPDLLLLDEVAGGHSADEVAALLNRIIPGDRPWRAVYGVSGGSQRGVIATRGTAPVPAAPFDRELPYPDSTHAILAGDTTQGAHGWLRSRLESRVPVTGAVVEIGGRRLLAVTVDLESGGAPGSAKDRLRRIEALEIRQAASAAMRESGVDGVLIAGDLNLVGTLAPLEVLSAGPDVDGGTLWAPRPLRLDGVSAATWEDLEQPFTPGRLDFVLVGDAALQVVGGFVFRAADLSARWRERHAVTESASTVTDHLPVVTDLRWMPRGG